jgi:hypothetical protein
MKLVFLAVLSIAPGLAAECPSSEMNPRRPRQFQELEKSQVEFRHAEFGQVEDFWQPAPNQHPAYCEPWNAT